MDYETFQLWQAYFSVSPEEMQKKVKAAESIRQIKAKRNAA